MIILTKELEERLDKAWYLIQSTIRKRFEHISQITLDEMSVQEVERIVEFQRRRKEAEEPWDE